MSEIAPIRHLTLYKHGVAYITRHGVFQGDRITLAMRPTDVDDALKSLAVFDRASGAVVSIDYDTPAGDSDTSESISKDPAQANLHLGAGKGLTDLLEALVGWNVRIDQEGGARTPTGRVLGLQTSGATEHHSLLLCRETTGVIESVKLSTIAAIAPLDAKIAERVRRLLDARRQPEGHRALNIRLQPGEHDVAISYLVPSPTWKVSYRAFAESPAQVNAPGKVRLQAWGVVDNLFGEDLDDVTLSLVAGQPISFQYELSKPVVPAREKVAEQSRRAAVPMEFGAANSRNSGYPPARGDNDLDYHTFAERQAPAASEAQATGTDLGALFEYRISSPVSMPMGTSALVPILDVTIEGKSELLFNQSKHELHPIRALLCENKTGSVLERGPVTVVEDGEYAGEALVPFTAVEGALYLPYAVELGVVISFDTKQSKRLTAIRLAKGHLVVEEARDTTVEYEVENKSNKQHEVLLECNRAELRGELQPDSAPLEIVGDVYRWKVVCPPWKTFTFEARSVLKEEQVMLSEEVTHDWLKSFSGTPLADSGSASKLNELLPLLEKLAACREDLEELRLRHHLLKEELTMTREVLATLRDGDNEDEGALRKELVAKMRTSVEQLETLQTQLIARKQEADDMDAKIAKHLTTLLGGR